jgi:dihydroxyacetone kinase-like protein
MERLINVPSDYAHDYLSGLSIAHKDLIVLNETPIFVRRVSIDSSKVMLISGGGSGHEPMHCGLVGEGMLDLAIPGEVFSSPSANQIKEAINSVSSDKGVFVLIKNYQGDVMNFEIACEMLNLPMRTFIVADDAAGESLQNSRGISGTIVYEKIIGAAAEKLYDLDELSQLASKIEANIGSFGSQLTSAQHPELPPSIDDPLSTTIELGVGIHGEKGIARVEEDSLVNLIERMVQPIEARIDLKASEKVLLLVNGFGGTPQSELYIAFRHTCELLERRGIIVERSLVGAFSTSLNAKGFSITLLRLDETLISLWDYKVKTPALTW